MAAGNVVVRASTLMGIEKGEGGGLLVAQLG